MANSAIEGLTATCATAFGLTVLPAGCMGFLNPCKNASKYQATCGVFYGGIHTRVSLSLWRWTCSTPSNFSISLSDITSSSLNSSKASPFVYGAKLLQQTFYHSPSGKITKLTYTELRMKVYVMRDTDMFVRESPFPIPVGILY